MSPVTGRPMNLLALSQMPVVGPIHCHKGTVVRARPKFLKCKPRQQARAVDEAIALNR